MAKPRRKKEKLGELQMNLTPMIDVVFLLISFFMIITQMVSQEIAVLYLPQATEAKPDNKPDPDRFILNITREGYVLMRGERLTPKLMKIRLKTEANRSRVSKASYSDRKILVRADQNALYDFVQLVMIKCTEVGIYQIQFAAKQKKDGD
ncbi:biopolymer transporter ExbD [bacterium AH-315-M10]|nr:biopolymer transporter ExbD [bacterium AH-315-M10]